MWTVVLRAVPQRSLAGGYGRFGGTCRLDLQGRRCKRYVTQKLETTCKSTITEDTTIHRHVFIWYIEKQTATEKNDLTHVEKMNNG
jgi:hypothetical protein